MLIIALDQDANMAIFSIFFNMKVYCVFSFDEAILKKRHELIFSI